MPKKSQQTRALTGRRVLTAQAEEGFLKWDYHPSPTVDSFIKPVNGDSQWKGVANKALGYYETYFDLSGYTLDDLTTFIVSGRVQDPGIHTFSGINDCFQIYDILSQERLTEADLRTIKENNTPTASAGPNQSNGPLDYSQAIYGRYRLFTKNSNLTSLPELMLTCRDVRFGSGHATAVEKLWWYRILVFTTSPDDDATMLIPASTFVLIVDVAQEGDSQYLMRLKRSFELAD
jgi:hypothetical protein